ncbi:MAG: hypothetical protein IPI00_17785 [Flavobacteriales bacterium]|nr:hypothetical protein [Flavobacteriales bacterium]
MKPTALILLLFTPLIAAAQAPSWLESSLYSGGKIDTVMPLWLRSSSALACGCS